MPAKDFAPFGLFLPSRLRFGAGEAVKSAADIRAFGRRLLVVPGRSPARAAALIDALEAAGAATQAETCCREPDLNTLLAALARARAFAPDAVVAIGGGSVLDLGKAMAALLPAPNPDPLAYLEVVGGGNPLSADPLPFIAVPTTAGTGSEATRNAVIGVPDKRLKVSLRDPRMIADLAIVDPSLTEHAPPAITLACGLDAVTQVIEPYLSKNANPVTDALCRDAIPRGLSALARLTAQEECPAARADLALVAYVSGIALANAGLGAVHGIAGVLGGMTGAPHGQICGQLLPPVLGACQAAAQPDSQTALRLAEIDTWCTTILGCGFDGLSGWARDHGLPLPQTRLTSDEALLVAEASKKASSMKTSPELFSASDLVNILEQAGWA